MVYNPSTFKRGLYIYLALVTVISPILLSCHKDAVSALSNQAVNSSSALLANGPSISSSSQTFIPGSILREVWNNDYGNDVAQVPVQTAPSSSSQITSLEGPINSGANYGVRIRGFIIPPATGSYTFWIAADDAGELWLSTDVNPNNKVQIAHNLSWTNIREWTKYADQKSKAITLQAGQKYYIEVLHKQGGGGGNLAVRWMLPDGTMESPISGIHLAPYITETDNTVYTAADVIHLEGKHDLTISGKFINGGTAPLITLKNCYNIHITGNKLSNSTQVGIYLYQCKNITIDDNYVTNVSSGVYAEQTNEGGIIVNNNQFLNMKGPFPRGQFVQFNNVKGPNSSISNNKGENILGQSYPEDAISLYQSAGTASSPVKITGNWIRGGGPSLSGGGIMLGDNGGSYLTATDNILVNPGQFGMAIAGGDHISIVNNMIYSKQQYFNNVGLYVNDINGYKTSGCTATANKVRYFNKDNYMNNAWLSPNSIKPEGWDSNDWGASLDGSILPSVVITKK
jgi:parallel beta-helix repeat protein